MYILLDDDIKCIPHKVLKLLRQITSRHPLLEKSTGTTTAVASAPETQPRSSYFSKGPGRHGV